MASHAGLITVVKTTKGYITEKGTLTSNVNKARKIYGLEFGFSDAHYVAPKLGYYNTSLGSRDYAFEIIAPSYESRIDQIGSYLREMGSDLRSSIIESHHIYLSKNLSNVDKYNKYIKTLEEEVYEYYKSMSTPIEVMIDGEVKKLYKVKEKHNKQNEYEHDKFYYEGKRLYRYSYYLKNPHVEKYFDISEPEAKELNNWQNVGLKEYILNNINELDGIKATEQEGELLNIYYTPTTRGINYHLGGLIRDYYSQREMHITRMFGSYIIIRREQGELKAIKATPIPIKYCPLMIKLLKEVGGELAEKLIASLANTNEEEQSKMMCELINEVVIKGGYFDTNRPLNSCEANVTFGASETIFSAFVNKLIDAAVIVSNNLGTIITTNALGTQGAVKRMTGLFYTSPNEDIVNTARKERIIPVFEYTAKIDQLAGVKEAIKQGYKRIAVSVAADDNYLHEELKKLEEEHNVTIYKFGLCSTGITEDTAKIMKEYADVIWSCASKQVREHIDPASIFQVGVKIPVYVMTEKGYEIIKNHLSLMNNTDSLEGLELTRGAEMPVALNNSDGIKLIKRKELHNCADCPHPCI